MNGVRRPDRSELYLWGLILALVLVGICVAPEGWWPW